MSETSEIINVGASDVGRVAVSKCGRYKVQFLSIARVDKYGNVFAVVKNIKFGEDYGEVYEDFHLVGGGLPMYWLEDPAKYVDYPEMTLDISAAVHASHKVNQPRDVFQVMAYLASETGECADWLVNPDRQKESLYGECADVIICALDLALTHKKQTTGLDGQKLADEVIADLNDLLKTKAEKWLDKHAAN